MKPIFGRTYNLTLGTLKIEGLRVSFHAKKSIKAEPNTLDLSVYNLSESHRATLEASAKTTCVLEAGYQTTGNHQIFLGEVRTSFTTVEGSDRITKVSAGDGEEKLATVHVNQSFGPRVDPAVALEAMCVTLGLGRGNLDAAMGRLRASGKILFPAGVSFSGKAWDELQHFAKSAELEISVQAGQLLILDRLRPLENRAVLLNSSTGLIGSPSRDSAGLVNASVLLIPELVPGQKVAFDSVAVKGGYRIESAEYVGDTHESTSWNANLVCRKY